MINQALADVHGNGSPREDDAPGLRGYFGQLECLVEFMEDVTKLLLDAAVH